MPFFGVCRGCMKDVGNESLTGDGYCADCDSIPPPSSIDPALIRVGVVFDTPYEKGCVVTTEPKEANGEFLALDSDGVECCFNVTGMPLYIR